MDRTPIEIGRTTRPMECELTAEERQQRSDQVHSELEIRAQRQAEQATLEAQAKATKEQAKAVEEAVNQLDLKIKALSAAARLGRETRQVDVLFVYEPARGEIVERRADTEATILARKPTSDEWKSINAKVQTPVEGTDPCRAPAAIPGIDPELLADVAEELEPGQALTIQVLGYRVGLREGGPFEATEERIEQTVQAIGAPELTKAERWAFAAGVKQAARDLARGEDTDDGTPFAAPPPEEEQRKGGRKRKGAAS